MIIVNLVLNSSLLSRYYFNQDKNYLIDKVEQIKNKYSGDISDIEFELKELSNIENIMVLVYSKSTNEPTLLSINTINFEDSRYYSQLEDYYYEKEDLIFDQFLATEMGLDDQSILIDNYRDMLTMEVIYRLNIDDFIVIEKMDLINKEHLDSLTTYQLLTALIIFLIVSMGVFYISSRFSKPIKELNSMTKEIAKFNLTSRHKIVSRDEIGELGESINKLSYTLENKILKLNEAILREKN